MKNIVKGLVLAVFLGSFALVNPAFASTPYLSATSQGNNNVLVSINSANPNSQVDLSSRQSSSLWTVVSNVGRTDNNGYFSQVISIPSDNSSSAIQLYVTVGGQQSSTVSVNSNGGGCYGSNCGGCTYNCGTNNSLTFSQTSPTLTTGQSSSVTIYSGGNNSYGYGSYYVLSNGNSSIVSASVSGQSLNLYGVSSGSSSIVVCQTNSSSVCGTLYVTVSGSGTCYAGSGYCGSGNLTFSQSSVSLNVGQTSSVTAYNSNGSLYISSNPSSSIATVSVSGNQINIYGNNNGSSNVIICSNNNVCGTLYITVNGSNGGYGNISLSQSTLNLTYPQTSTVTISGGNYNNSYYVYSNSNSNIAGAVVNGNVLNVSALSSGNTSIVVCQNSYTSQCATLYVTVSGNNGCYNNCGSLTLSQSNVSLNVGQNSTVTVNNYNGGSLYISSNTNSNIATASINGSNVVIYGVGQGSANIYVCSNSSSCATIYVIVNGGNGNTGSLTFSPSSQNLNLGQNSTIYINGPYSSSGLYYVSSNYNSNVVNASISGNSLFLTGNGVGSSNIVVCQNGTSYCGTFYVTVGSNGSGNSSLVLSQTNFTLSPGQTTNVNIYGNGSYYVSSNSNNYAATATISGNSVNIYGVQNGSTNIIICQVSNASCGTLYVSVSGNNNNNNNNNNNSGGLQYPGGAVLGASNYPNGQLIGEGGTVYIVYKNTKTGFSSGSVFTGLGFKFSNVLQVGTSGLNSSGYTVNTTRSSHPWGSWVKNGSTIYFVHEQGLIAVPNWDLFLANGGQASLVVPANSWDLSLPILSKMVYNDSRLQ